MTAAIVSAADSGYFHLLKGLVLSLRALPAARALPKVVLDMGLAPEERHWLSEQGVSLVDGQEPVAGLATLPPPRPGRRGLSAAQRLRPKLPELVPGHEIYLWMDADLWVQLDWAVPLFLRAAAAGGMAIVPEVNVSYRSLYGPQQLRGLYALYAELFDKTTAEALAPNPTINSGLFALRGDAPHWRLWDETLQSALARENFYYAEQLALNHLLYTRPQEAPARFLPANCNWICHQALPVLDSRSGLLCDPTPPYQALAVVHLTVAAKDGEHDLRATDGSRVRRSLKYLGGAY